MDNVPFKLPIFIMMQRRDPESMVVQVKVAYRMKIRLSSNLKVLSLVNNIVTVLVMILRSRQSLVTFDLYMAIFIKTDHCIIMR